MNTNEKKRKTIKLMKIGFAFARFSTNLDLAGPSGELEDLVVFREFKEDIVSGVIKLPQLVDSITRSYADKINGIVFGYKFCGRDEDFNEYEHYFMIATMDGVFFFIDRNIAFVEYEAFRSVRQDPNGVVVSASKVNWYSEDGSDKSGDDEIVIERNRKTERYLGRLIKTFEDIISSMSEEGVDEFIEHNRKLAEGGWAIDES